MGVGSNGAGDAVGNSITGGENAGVSGVSVLLLLDCHMPHAKDSTPAKTPQAIAIIHLSLVILLDVPVVGADVESGAGVKSGVGADA
jgi:hypothetical protein